jgi:hypothetical protein
MEEVAKSEILRVTISSNPAALAASWVTASSKSIIGLCNAARITASVTPLSNNTCFKRIFPPGSRCKLPGCHLKAVEQYQ